jgi:hypothetical protein
MAATMAMMATTAMMMLNCNEDNVDQAATTVRVTTTVARARATGAKRVTATMAMAVTMAMMAMMAMMMPNSKVDAKRR